jgi:hypothetical protein
LKYFTYHLVPVEIMATNYKQHILSPTKVRKVCYSLVERYENRFICNYSGGGGVKFMKHFKEDVKYKKNGNLWSSVYGEKRLLDM